MTNLISEIQTLVVHHFTLKSIFAGVLTVLSFFFDLLLAKIFLILLLLTLADCLLGYYRALKDKRAIVSKLMRNYAWRFAGYTMTASVLFMVAQGMPNVAGIPQIVGYLDDIVLAFFIVQEAISVMEHLNELGVPMPQSVFANLRKIKDKLDDPTDQYKPSLK